MPITTRRSAAACLAVAAALSTLPAAPAHAETASAREHAPALDAVDQRWREAIDAFAAADALKAPEPGGVRFVGSSSIRL